MIEVLAILAFAIGMFGTYTVLDIINKVNAKKDKTKTKNATNLITVLNR